MTIEQPNQPQGTTMKTEMKQKKIDKMKKRVIQMYHDCVDLHQMACNSQCPKAHDVTADMLALSLQMKKAGMSLNGCMDEGDGGVTVMSGGT